MQFQIIPGYDHTEEIIDLFQEYTNKLIEIDDTFRTYLSMQNYEKEHEDPTQKYGPPKGRLYLARVDGRPAGCIALLPREDGTCELKRLYVKPEYRGHDLGRQLIQRILDDAKEIGYQTVFLDTLPYLESAYHLYQDFGFTECPPFNESPMELSIFLRKDLTE